MKYKGYIAQVKFDDRDKIFWGKVINITKDSITFEGSSVEKLERDFHDAVDDYIEICEERGVNPEDPFSGKFIVRIPAELHSAVVEESARQDVSLNKFVENAIKHELGV